MAGLRLASVAIERPPEARGHGGASSTEERAPSERRSGAGGNRTPVHQSVDGLATTIPDIRPTQVGRRVGCSPEGGPRIVFPNGQRSFSPSAVFPAVIPHFCCRAVMDWPRATFLLTMTLHSPENQAARANCSSAILVGAPFSESEQLGSQTRPTVLMSKPVSPEIVPVGTVCSDPVYGERRSAPRRLHVDDPVMSCRVARLDDQPRD